MYHRSGFTLVELLVVFVILGILMAIAVPNFKKYQAKHKERQAAIANGTYISSKTQKSSHTNNESKIVCMDGYKFINNQGYVKQVLNENGSGITCSF